MELLSSGTAAPAIAAVFLSSIVEAVEAFTVVLAVGTIRGWRPALTGTAAGLAVLASLIIVLGPALNRIPLQWLQLLIGVLLLLFGMRWLRKAILRYAPYHDETAIFAAETRDLAIITGRSRAEWVALITTFKAVLLEGLEVVFIVIAVGAGPGLLWPASVGAAAACALVLGAGFFLYRPLARVPENALKFGVGAMLSAFGVFWTGEGLGIHWPGSDLALVGFILCFLSVAALLVRLARPRTSPWPVS
jgi:uncharacterized membrane protein